MLRALCLCLALLCPVPAPADPWSFSGRVTFGATDLKGGTGIGMVDVTLSVPLGHRFDVEIGTYLFALEGKRPHETYAALVVDDRWRIGAVRPAYDAVLPSVFSRVAHFLAYERAEYALAHATVEAMRNTAVPWGLSWQRRSAQTDLAFSAHDAVKGKFRTLSASLARRGEGRSLAAAIEPVWLRDGSYVGTNAKLGGRADVGTGSVGIALLHPEGNETRDALALDVAMALTGHLDMLVFGEATGAAQDTVYGIALDYHIRPDSSALVSITGGAGGSGLHLTLERRF